jgi:GDP-4-dehydro-6-deoxy-D-mannose reductase
VDLPLVVDPARMRPVDLPDLVGDPTRLHRATGWEPAIDLQVTLADVLHSFDDQGAAPA